MLNENRQIVYANESVKKLFPGDPFEIIYGKRPGELLSCSHYKDSPSGCGTTKFCSECGAVKSILSSLAGNEFSEECRIIQSPGGAALDLRVWTKRISIKGENYVVFSLTDISDEKRRKALERTFFHDVINTADSLLKISEMLKEADGDELASYNDTIYSLSNRLIDEIKSQRDLLSAENNELRVSRDKCSSLNIISDVIVLYTNHRAAEEKKIIIDKNSEDTSFLTDEVLLKRVLGNMMKNALESSTNGDRVKIGTRYNNNEIEFYIHNNGFMPEHVQLQVFQRSFSTKGAGRGLGTYSMKLLTERYLQGKVLFESTEENGTTFYARFPKEI